MARRLEVEIIGDPRSLQKAFGQATRSSTSFGSRLKTLGKTAGLVAAGGVAALGVGLKKSMDAAREAEVSQKRLQAQLKALGISYRQHGDVIDDTLKKQSMLSAFDDEELADSFTQLVRATGDVNKALEQNALAADIARAKGIGVEQAALMVTKASMGQLGALRRVGIDIQKVTTAQDALGKSASESAKEQAKAADLAATKQQALALLQEKFAGQAKAYGETAAGAQERFGVAMENLGEVIGAKVLPALVPLINGLATFINKAAESERLKEILSTTFQIIGDTARVLGDIFKWLAEMTDRYWPQIRQTVQGVIDWFKTNIVPTVSAVISTIVALWRRFGDDVLAVLRPVFAIMYTIIKTALENIKAIIEFVMAVIRGDWGKAWNALKTLVSNTLNGLKAVATTALTNLIPTLLNLAAQLGKAILTGIGDGLKNLPNKVHGWLGKIGGEIEDIAKKVPAWAASIGRALIDGIIDGLSGLVRRVGTFIKNGVQSAIDFALAPFKNSPQEIIGVALVEGVARGIEKMPDIKIANALKAKVAAAIDLVKEAQGEFTSAFGTLASDVLSAFDAMVSAWKPPAQRLLDKRQLDRQKTELKQAILDADKEIATARQAQATALAQGDVDAYNQATQQLLDAQKQRANAIVARDDFNLQQRAAKQQEAHDKQAAHERIAFANQLMRLQEAYGNQEITTKEFHKRLNALMHKHGLDQEFFGTATGISFANGIQKSTAAVVRAATRLAKAMEKYLKLKPKGSWDTEEGPMADFGHWWDNFAPGLIGGIDYQAIATAGSDAARSLWGGVQRGMAEWEGAANIDWFPDLKDADPKALADALGVPQSTEALDTIGDSFDSATSTVDIFRDAVVALPSEAKQALIDLATIIEKALKPLPEILSPVQVAVNLIADAIHRIGSEAYYARNALRDTVAEILALAAQIGGYIPPPKQFGGPVGGGRAYLIGERGPELFVPSTSGNIVANSRLRTGGGGGSTIIVNVAGSVLSERDLTEVVRRGLYQVSRRNPGALPGIA